MYSLECLNLKKECYLQLEKSTVPEASVLAGNASSSLRFYIGVT
jgi:hypothetical protein